MAHGLPKQGGAPGLALSSTTVDGLGTSLGNPWGDWLNVNETTPVEFIDTCYHALDCTLMAER